jgi:hypothetical protein
METNNKINDNLDEFLGKDKVLSDNVIIKEKGELVEKVDKKLIVEDGRELLREITYNRY